MTYQQLGYEFSRSQISSRFNGRTDSMNIVKDQKDFEQNSRSLFTSLKLSPSVPCSCFQNDNLFVTDREIVLKPNLIISVLYKFLPIFFSCNLFLCNLITKFSLSFLCSIIYYLCTVLDNLNT